MSIKTLYTYDVPNEVEVDKTETKIEGEGADAKTITTVTKVKESRPLTFAIKKPSKDEREEMEIVRDVSFKYFVERGLITEGNLRKLYGENGGVYTTAEEIHYSTLRDKIRLLITDYQRTALSENEDEKKKASAIFHEIFAIRQQILEFEKSATLFYERTAEAKAQKKAVEHYLVNLVYQKKDTPLDQPIAWEPYFKGTIEERLKGLAKLEDDADPIYLQIRDRAMLVCMVLVTNSALTTDQLKQQVDEATNDI